MSFVQRPTYPRLLGLTIVALAALATPSVALATPEYPVTLDLTLETSCPFPNSRCLICHTTSRGGQGTASQLFALELRDRGLNRGRDPGLLQSVLMALPEETDSDRDGESDKDELRRCGNPSGEDLGIGPEYGCDGARLAPRGLRELSPLAGSIALALVGLAAVGRFRRPR